MALCLPLVCLMLLGVVQVAVIVRDQLLVQHAAREAARAAAVSASPAAAAQITTAVVDRAAVAVASSANRVTVTVTRTTHTDVPLIGALLPDVVLTASASMAREPP